MKLQMAGLSHKDVVKLKLVQGQAGREKLAALALPLGDQAGLEAWSPQRLLSFSPLQSCAVESSKLEAAFFKAVFRLFKLSVQSCALKLCKLSCQSSPLKLCKLSGQGSPLKLCKLSSQSCSLKARFVQAVFLKVAVF